MLFLNKLYKKLKVINKDYDLKDLYLDILSHLLNLSNAQRYYRRKKFSLSEIVYNSINDRDYIKYHEFLAKYSFYYRKNSNRDYFSSILLNINSRQLYHVARFRNMIIGSVSLTHFYKYQDINFWLIAGLCILREYQGCGVGENLVNSIIFNVSGENNIVFLSVDQTNFRAIKLYRKLGFSENESLKKVVLKAGQNDFGNKNFALLFKLS